MSLAWSGSGWDAFRFHGQYALHCGMLSVASTQCEGWPPRYSRALYQALSVEPQAYERKNQNKRDTNFPNV